MRFIWDSLFLAVYNSNKRYVAFLGSGVYCSLQQELISQCACLVALPIVFRWWSCIKATRSLFIGSYSETGSRTADNMRSFSHISRLLIWQCEFGGFLKKISCMVEDEFCEWDFASSRYSSSIIVPVSYSKLQCLLCMILCEGVSWWLT